MQTFTLFICRNLKRALLYLFSENYRKLNKKKQHTDAILETKPAGQLGACVESCGKIPPKLLPLGPRSHECDDKPTKIERYLNLPKLLMSGQKIGCIINK